MIEIANGKGELISRQLPFVMMRFLLAALVLVFGTFSSPAGAEPSPADLLTARKLAREAQDALSQGHFGEAEAGFRKAYRLVPAPTVGVGLARALSEQGKLIQAHETYTLVLRTGVEKDAPEPFHLALEDARREAAALEKRLAWVTIKVSGDADRADIQVTLDGEAVPENSWGIERATNPGKHEVRAEAPGFLPVSDSFEVAEGEHVKNPIDLHLVRVPQQSDGAEPVITAPQAGGPVGDSGVETESGGGSGQATVGYVALSLGVVGLAAGGYFGAQAMKKQKDLNDACLDGGFCPPSQKQAVDDFHQSRLLAVISGAAGGALAITGTVLIFTAGGDDESPTVSVAPYLTLGGVGATGRF